MQPKSPDIQDDFHRLNCPGTLSYTIGSDLGLRDDNWGFAIVADFTDVDAYRNYDLDPAHNQARAAVAACGTDRPGPIRGSRATLTVGG